MSDTEDLKKEITSIKIRLQRIEEMLTNFPNPDNYIQNRGGLDDPLYEEAEKVVKEYDEASASLLQRRLSIGYSRAARILDTMEEQGIVGKAEGAKPRKVLKKN